MESIIGFIIQFIVAGFATFSFAVLFSAPKKELLYCGFSGAFGWILYYILVQLGMGVVVPSLIATFCLTILARIFAVIRSTPVTVYLLTGIFPLVPGAGIFTLPTIYLPMTGHFLLPKELKPLKLQVQLYLESSLDSGFHKVCFI